MISDFGCGSLVCGDRVPGRGVGSGWGGTGVIRVGLVA